MVLEDKRTETQFEVRDHMLDIWKQITELCFRGFGLKKRKIPKEPKNFAEWSEKSKEKWLVDEQEKYNRKLQWDNGNLINQRTISIAVHYILSERQTKWQHQKSIRQHKR